MSSGDNDFPKSYKLNKASEFRFVFDSAFKSVDSCFLVLARTNTQTHARLGMALSKKHLTLATQRNKIKRLLRESFRNNRDSLGNLDIVVLAQKHTGSKDKQSLSQSIENHWKKISKCNAS